MKTQSTTCNPSVTMTMTAIEAMTILHALQHFDRTHRKHPVQPGQRTTDDGLWGHYDCPPDLGPLFQLIQGTIHKEHPNLYEMWFGPAKSYKPVDRCAPIE